MHVYLKHLTAEMNECNHCHTKAASLPVCKRCHTTYYCGRACQSKAWHTHKHDCKKKEEQGSALALLPQEVIYEVFQYLGVRSLLFFRCCKRLTTLREWVLTQHYIARKISLGLLRDKNARMDIRVLLAVYRWPKIDESGRYVKFKRIVLNFIANKKRLEMVYQCRNAYHRRLVHLFCESQDLAHRTIETGETRRCKKECRFHCFCVRQRESAKAIIITKKS